MAVQLIALYTTPPDPAAFLAHYRHVHWPLMRQFPGVTAITVEQVGTSLMGPLDVFLMARMTFPDRAQLDAALASPAGRAAARDLASFAPNGVTLLIGEDWA